MPLQVALKTTFRHAAATRNEGESIWVQAKRNGNKGYGEGCPRVYVAGDDLDSSVKWVKENFSSGKVDFETLDDLKQWVEKNEKKSIITHRHGVPWKWRCLICFPGRRVAPLKNCWDWTTANFVAATLPFWEMTKNGNIPHWLDQYLIRGFSDFKIKLNGNLERDIEKLRYS